MTLNDIGNGLSRIRLPNNECGPMKITLDHNCILDLELGTDVGSQIKAIIENPQSECFVVNIGASELRKSGVKPDRYDLFEELLSKLGIAHLSRLNPMGILNVTFWDRCVFTDEAMIQLAKNIEQILFGNSKPIVLAQDNLDSPNGRKWLNRICDVHTMWCHIQNRNEVFLTTDKNYLRATKYQKLVDLGAMRICRPCDIYA